MLIQRRVPAAHVHKALIQDNNDKKELQHILDIDTLKVVIITDFGQRQKTA